jgi:hypothetical protein
MPCPLEGTRHGFFIIQIYLYNYQTSTPGSLAVRVSLADTHFLTPFRWFPDVTPILYLAMNYSVLGIKLNKRYYSGSCVVDIPNPRYKYNPIVVVRALLNSPLPLILRLFANYFY